VYSLFSSEIRKGFIEQELAREYLSFPDEIDEAYSAMINWLRSLEGMADFDKHRTIDLESQEMVHTGRQFSILLPGHTMKVYRTLLDVESKAITAQLDSILEQSCISLIDDGCGGGTASVALISLIVNYQKYRLANGLPIFPFRIKCLGIDRNDNALKAYCQFLGHCTEPIKPLLVEVDEIAILPGTLPSNSAQVSEWIEAQDRTRFVLLMLSNLILSLTEEFEEMRERRSVFDLIGLGRFLPSRWGRDIGSEETAAIGATLNTCRVDQVLVMLVSAHTYEEVDDGKVYRSWQKEMKAFQSALSQELKRHRVSIHPVSKQQLRILNPPASYHRRRLGYEVSPDIDYDSGFVSIHSQDYVQDEDWQKILDPENLLLAWARVRNALSFEMLEDTIEIRLFEANIEERLSKLRSEVLSYRWDVLNIPEMLNFCIPKGSDKEPRPMSTCRLEDQILATAIFQVKQQEYETANHCRSFAYKLSTRRRGELLYEGWWKRHPEFLEAARKAAIRNPSYQVICTDLSSYYTDIVQAELLAKVKHLLVLYHSRNRDLAKNLIDRDCGTGRVGCGIPQGHIVSGAMANLYLSEVDRLFEPGNVWGIEYFRFVDDMIFVFPPALEADSVLDLLDQKLSELTLRLTRSLGKTSEVMSTQDFLKLTAPDTRLAELRKQHNYLLSDLYKLGRDYIQIGLGDWWGFVGCYQRLLASIGVYINVPWLSRQLQKNLRWWRKTVNWWHKLRMPEANRLEDLQNVDEWQVEFRRLNGSSPQGWMDRREKLVQGLSDVFREGLASLNADSELERKRGRTYVTFAVFRLGQLGFGEKAGEVVDLIVEQPWVLRLRRVCQDLGLQGREDLLLDALDRVQSRDEEEWAYVRGTILKALTYLSSVSESTIELLREAAFNGKTIVERTMASEALFLLRRAEGLQKVELVDALEQAGDDYLSKNYALLYAIAPGDAEAPRVDLSRSSVVNEALEYVRVSPSLDEIFRYEPEILREEFYEGEYPYDPEAFEDFPYGS
jgi:hypothetical protein